jgi:hypothetical protein
MLPDHLQELLTASVDGELSTAERKIVERLLRTSEEARAFHAKLVQDASLLRGLPRSIPEFDFAGAIVNAIVEDDIRPTPLPTRRRRTSWNNSLSPSWVPMALAASVVLVIGIGSYLYFAASNKVVVQKEQDSNPPAKNEGPARNPTLPKQDDPQPARSQHPIVVQAEPEVAPLPREVKEQIVAKVDPEVLPTPRTVDEVNASNVRSPSIQGLESLEKIRLPLILPLRDLDQAYPRDKFHEDLKKDEVIRIDLFSRDTAKATELLNAILKHKGHQLFVEALVTEHFKKKQPTEILFFTESLTAEEFAQVMEQLGADDKKLESKKTGDGIFDKFVLTPCLAGDLDKLARLLGVTPANLKMPKPKVPLTFDPRRPWKRTRRTLWPRTSPRVRQPRSSRWCCPIPP